MLSRKRIIGILFVVLILNSVSGQLDSTIYTKHLPSFTHRPLIAGIETISTNIIVNRLDAWVLGFDWAKVTADHWKDNLHAGFQTDGDPFATNLFGHPYHGSMFFNSARQHGASFWGSIPYVMLGSWTWEHFGETFPASEIDWNTTTLGGVFLGEMTHRLAAHLLRSDKRRDHRFVRNLTALIINPMVQINGLMNSEIYNSIRDDNQREFPVRSQFSVGYGRKFNFDNNISDRSVVHMNYSLMYGDFFDNDRQYQPFDYFILRSWLELFTSGASEKNYFSLMAHAPLWKIHKNRGSIFSLSSHYDFLHNQAFKIGAISLTTDFHIKKYGDSYELLASIKAGPTLFGSASSDVVEEIEIFNQNDGEFLRDYVYGKGFLLEFEVFLQTKKYGKLISSFNNWTIFTQRDTPGTERNSIFKIEYYYPIWNNIGLGLEFFNYKRRAHYDDHPDFQDINEGYSELKLSSFISF